MKVGQDARGIWVGLSVIAALVVATLALKWNADGPGTNAGGDGAGRSIEEPAAVTVVAATPVEQRRRERAAVAGTVRDAEGRGIEGAMVCAVASSTLLSTEDRRWPRCTRSGSEGRYRIDDLFGVRQRVSANVAGYLPADHSHAQGDADPRAIDLRPGGEARDVDVVLRRGGVQVRGVVRDLQGRPIAGAWVASGAPDRDAAVAWAVSGMDGQFTLSASAGGLTVTALATGHVTGRVAAPTDGRELSVYLAPSAVLRGTVVRAGDHAPVEGAWVHLDLDDEAVQTDAAGHFQFAALPPGIYAPRVEAGDGFGMAAEQVSLGLGETSQLLTITVHPAVSAEGRVLIAGSDRACEDGSVTLRDAMSGHVARGSVRPAGLVRVHGLLPGTYTATVVCDGAFAAGRYPALVVGADDVRGQVWRVSPGPTPALRPVDAIASSRPPSRIGRRGGPTRTIHGVLRDADGQRVVGALVEAQAEADLAIGGPVHVGDRPQLTDGEGRFALAGLTGAAYTVTAQRVGGGAARREHVTGGETLALVLARTGQVTGTVNVYGGEVPEWFVIDMIEAQTGEHHRQDFIATAGAWGFTGLPRGHYTVHVHTREGTTMQELALTGGAVHSVVRVDLMGAPSRRWTAMDLDAGSLPLDRFGETAHDLAMLRGHR